MAVEDEETYHLDPRVRIVWSLNVLGAGLIFWVVSTLLASAFFTSLFGMGVGLFPLLFFFIALVIVLPYILWIELNYQNYTYTFLPKRFRVSKGVFNKERVIIPYEKIQNININHNILERALGIATVKIETAGTNPGESEGVIEGIGDYKEFAQRVMARVHEMKKEARHEKEKDEEDERKKTGSMGNQELLTEILKELKELKTVMGNNSKPPPPRGHFPKK